MVCPVCNTPSPSDNAQNCTTCGWYFPLKDTPQFQLELGRAKQQFQMVNSFNQMFQHMQIQSKMLEKISFRLDGLENEVNVIKENRPTRAIVQQKYEYPALDPIQKCEDFDTPEKRAEWWNGLEDQWKEAFKQGILQKSQYHELNDKDYAYILESPTARFVGPRGMHPNLNFELTNLSGLKHLSRLSILVASHQALTSLSGIEHLNKLTSLFINSNKLTSLKELYYLPQLQKLYCNVNQIVDLQPIEKLTNLETIYCCYNQLESLEGITAEHVGKLIEFVVLPNDRLKPNDIKEVEELGIFCKKG